MHYTKNIYNKETLLGMLHFAIDSMIENEICTLCKYRYDKKAKHCSHIDICRINIFDGLLKRVRETRGKNAVE